MLTLIRECRNPKDGKKLEIFAYELHSEAMIEFFSHYNRISDYSEEYRKYYRWNNVIDEKFFIKNSNERWDEFKQIFSKNEIKIKMIGMLVENTQGKQFEDCDKIFSILIEGPLYQNESEELEKVSNYFEIKKELIICDKCNEKIKVSVEDPNGGGFYGCHSLASYYEIAEEFDSEGKCFLYFYVKGHQNGKILIKKDQEKYRIGNKICEYCMDPYDEEKFETIEMH